MQSDALPAELPVPQALRDSAIALDHLGVCEVAWSRRDALQIVDALRETAWAILGGDVLVHRDGAFAYSYDNWHSDPQPEEVAHDFIARSHRETRDYIARYPEKELPIAYVLVFDQCI